MEDGSTPAAAEDWPPNGTWDLGPGTSSTLSRKGQPNLSHMYLGARYFYNHAVPVILFTHFLWFQFPVIISSAKPSKSQKLHDSICCYYCCHVTFFLLKKKHGASVMLHLVLPLGQDTLYEMQKCRAAPGTSVQTGMGAFKATVTGAGTGIVDSHQRGVDKSSFEKFKGAGSVLSK
ncbi:hypothetical protein GH733_006550 [Mirounga leonina]|nr:hypothetical protein GH733_006550 [Mirounga leonina]